MEKLLNTPELRFPEFEGEWEKDLLKSYTSLITKGTTPFSFSEKGINFIKIECFEENRINKHKCLFINEQVHFKELKRSILKESDILFAIAGATIGKANIVTADILPANTNQALAIVRLINLEHLNFIFQVLKSEIMQKYINDSISVGAQPNLNLEQLGNFPFYIPGFPEQQKIAQFLSSVDEKIQALKKKKSLLEQYKKGMMQKIFSQELRFKDENGNEFPEWEEKTLGDIARRVTRKNKIGNINVLTISAQHGLVSQLDFFNKSVSAKDLSGYYLLNQGEFAYNKSYSKGYPMGAIKQLKKYDSGVVSTLYICFSFIEEIDLQYMEHFFESGTFNQELEIVAQEGARNHGLLNIGLDDFFNCYIKLPSLNEQTKIANFLDILDIKIEQVSNQLAKMEQWKKGLLQKMFV
ncbi:restriction endonuclease subunit S [Flectobacillus longus]|uniref:restriction endonuclease subunit S n=1 Tax=Flectobacillus longus TaxID=2984207 RepID=UPI0024B689BD|nr:restriction endonuclease subunit S [Flectobacillus longus]MDI9882745.1 restriction endonuclease subunit S [Flectobacillus longus]